MQTLKVQGSNWAGEAVVREASHFYNVMIRVEGETKEDALSGIKFLRDVFAFGRVGYMRTEPEVTSDTDFDTKITRHIGFARLGFKFEAGELLSVVANPDHVPGLGLMQVKAG